MAGFEWPGKGEGGDNAGTELGGGAQSREPGAGS